MKKIQCLLVMLLSLLLTACGVQMPSFEETALPSQETRSASFSFADVDGLQFVFASGAGGWGTVMYIHEDGSFEGSYSDSIMETAPEYPNGSCYYSEFSGRFTQPEKVNDTTWRFQIAEFTERYQRGTEEVRDGVRYLYAAPHGLSESENWYVYLPGAQLEDLPQPFLDWVHLPSWENPEETELSFYGLYNEKEEFGFSSYVPQSVYELMLADITYTEETVAAIKARLENEGATQADMNGGAEEIYWVWDGLLNREWSCLKVHLDSQTMGELTDLQLNWIKDKEADAEAAAAEAEGGSMHALLYYSKAAELTRERVYVLAEYLK